MFFEHYFDLKPCNNYVSRLRTKYPASSLLRSSLSRKIEGDSARKVRTRQFSREIQKIVLGTYALYRLYT